jgi:hypothetical protein
LSGGERLVGKLLWPCLPSFVLTCELEILEQGTIAKKLILGLASKQEVLTTSISRKFCKTTLIYLFFVKKREKNIPSNSLFGKGGPF